jgi:hypothetical protein
MLGTVGLSYGFLWSAVYAMRGDGLSEVHPDRLQEVNEVAVVRAISTRFKGVVGRRYDANAAAGCGCCRCRVDSPARREAKRLPVLRSIWTLIRLPASAQNDLLLTVNISRSRL